MCYLRFSVLTLLDAERCCREEEFGEWRVRTAKDRGQRRMCSRDFCINWRCSKDFCINGRCSKNFSPNTQSFPPPCNNQIMSPMKKMDRRTGRCSEEEKITCVKTKIYHNGHNKFGNNLSSFYFVHFLPNLFISISKH